MLPLFLLAVACLCDARPHMKGAPTASFGVLGIDNYIIGGEEAAPGSWPWQLSQTNGGSHSCGASLLSDTKALSAGHCVFGASPDRLTIIAGLHTRTDPDSTGAIEVNVDSHTIHEEYGQGDPGIAYPNDISIIYLASAITENGGNIQYLTLPPDDTNLFTGDTCTLTGWGRTSSSNTLPDDLQQVEIEVIDNADCNDRMSSVSGAGIWDGHICFYDSGRQEGSCNGDSGGPGNCPDGSDGYYVAGVTSWGISSGGDCLQTYPSVYTRTSEYLDWINSH